MTGEEGDLVISLELRVWGLEKWTEDRGQRTEEKRDY